MSAEDLQNLESSSEEEGEQDSNRASQSSSPSTSTEATRKKSIHGSASPSTPRLPSSLAAKMAAMVNRGSNGQANAGGQPIGSSLRSMRQAPLPPNQLKDKMEALSMNDKVKVEENNNPPPNSLAARRGMKLNINGPQSSNDASPAKRRGPPGKLNLSNQDGKADTPFSNFSNIVDPSGKLNFGEGKAILHASGVNFSTGHSFNIKIEDLELQDELGRGAYGSVRKAKHKLTGVVMAIKEIRLELDKTKLAGIAMELDILHRAVKPQIVEFYGAFFVEGCIFYCMEFMDAGSLDKLYSPTFGIPEDILAFVTRDLIIGLQFLKEELQIIHRDVKPTNVLVNRRGKIKICDFGVSGQLEKSLAKTNIGCQSYMAVRISRNFRDTSNSLFQPERIQSPESGVHGGFYSVSSDVWSLGLTMVECARGEYPYTFQNVLAQLQEIVKGPAPELPSYYSDTAKEFIHSTLRKDPNQRPGYQELLEHPFLNQTNQPNVLKWIEDALRSKNDGNLPDSIPESDPSRHFDRV
ncbi:kinase-like protein [Wallemia mellicola]|nr:kinase-like protein [Wallemia mellicola]